METALYLPVKRFLEKLGFTVKGEVGGCDLVALSGDDPPIVVIGELKLPLQSRTDPARRSIARVPATRCGSPPDCRARQGPRERRALSQSLPPSRLRHARRHRHRRRRSDRRAADHRPAPRFKKRSRLVAEHQRRKGDPAWRRQHARADHDGLSPAGVRLRVGAGGRTTAREGSKPANPDRRKIFCTMSMAGSIAPSAAFTC